MDLRLKEDDGNSGGSVRNTTKDAQIDQQERKLRYSPVSEVQMKSGGWNQWWSVFECSRGQSRKREWEKNMSFMNDVIETGWSEMAHL